MHKVEVSVRDIKSLLIIARACFALGGGVLGISVTKYEVDQKEIAYLD